MKLEKKKFIAIIEFETVIPITVDEVLNGLDKEEYNGLVKIESASVNKSTLLESKIIKDEEEETKRKVLTHVNRLRWAGGKTKTIRQIV